MKILRLLLLILVGSFFLGCQEEQVTKAGKCRAKKYEPTW